MRPNTSVRSTSATTTPTLSASSAGRNWIFAIQPSHPLSAPVKSRNSMVIPIQNNHARITLSFFSILDFHELHCILGGSADELRGIDARGK